MDTNVRLSRLERIDANNRLNVFKHKCVQAFSGYVDSSVDITFRAKEGSVARLSIYIDSATQTDVIVGGVKVFSGVISCSTCDFECADYNTLQLQVASTCFVKLVLSGEIEYFSPITKLVALDDSLVAVCDNKAYLNDISTIIEGDFDVYGDEGDLPDVYTFNSFTVGGNIANLFAYYDNGYITICNLSDASQFSFSLNTQPISLALMYIGGTYDYACIAMHRDHITFYYILSGAVADSEDVALSGVVYIDSVIGATTSFVCAKANIVYLATVSFADGVTIGYTQLCVGGNVVAYADSTKLYIVNMQQNNLTYKILLLSDMQTLHLSKYANIGGAFVSGNKLYGISRGILQVLHDN